MNRVLTFLGRYWRMSRMPFALYLLGIGLCILAFFNADRLAGVGGSVETNAWLLAAFGILALPLVVSMRLRDIGRSVLWAVLPMIAMLVLGSLILSALASVSGTPGAMDPTFTEVALEKFAFVGLGMLGLLTLYCLFAPSKSAAYPNEATP